MLNSFKIFFSIDTFKKSCRKIVLNNDLYNEKINTSVYKYIHYTPFIPEFDKIVDQQMSKCVNNFKNERGMTVFYGPRDTTVTNSIIHHLRKYKNSGDIKRIFYMNEEYEDQCIPGTNNSPKMKFINKIKNVFEPSKIFDDVKISDLLPEIVPGEGKTFIFFTFHNGTTCCYDNDEKFRKHLSEISKDAVKSEKFHVILLIHNYDPHSQRIVDIYDKYTHVLTHYDNTVFNITPTWKEYILNELEQNYRIEGYYSRITPESKRNEFLKGLEDVERFPFTYDSLKTHCELKLRELRSK